MSSQPTTAAIAGADTPVSKLYMWTVFFLTYALFMHDYLARQIIASILPVLKTTWSLSDSQLGGLVSIVALTVAVMTIPLSLVADRWGRVKSITLMAVVWCLATIACGMAENYYQMLIARAVVGLGEAAYGAAGAALLAHAFPAHRRASILGAFQSAAMFGSVLGVVLGGAIAAAAGWRMAFYIVGAAGLVFAVVYPFFVRDYKTVKLPERHPAADGAPPVRGIARIGVIVGEVFRVRSANFAYLGYGMQVGIAGLVTAWTPTYLNRYFGMPLKQAALMAAVAVLALGIGLVFGGIISDRLASRSPRFRALAPAAFATICGILLMVGYALPPGPLALGVIVAGALFAVAPCGPAVAMALEVTHPSVRATVTATMSLFGNGLGNAVAPFIVGLASDVMSLKTALTLAPAISLVGALCFLLASRSHQADIAAQNAAAA